MTNYTKKPRKDFFLLTWEECDFTWDETEMSWEGWGKKVLPSVSYTKKGKEGITYIKK